MEENQNISEISKKKYNVLFFMRHFTGRGVENAIYDYAHYNETILGNKSYIVCFTKETQGSFGSEVHFPTTRNGYERFNQRFKIIEISHMSLIRNVINDYNIHFFYTQPHGKPDFIYEFDNKYIWENCKTIKHSVFDTRFDEGDFHFSISEFLNLRFKTELPVIPYIVPFNENDRLITSNLRADLGIPENAVVFGRYGAYDQFNIPMVHNAIFNLITKPNFKDLNIYFLFMNTAPLFSDVGQDLYHPHIIYLPANYDNTYKIKFINSCDAMIHARKEGETFGLAVAEFSSLNKPIITSVYGDVEHLLILNNKGIIYANDLHLVHIFKNFKNIISWNKENDWNAYKDYTPEKVMDIFDKQIFSKYEE